MTFKEMCETLRLERERQGLETDEITRKTKISRRNLEALEEGRIDDLPHYVYVQGFVKTYTQFLGLDYETFKQAVDEAYKPFMKEPKEEHKIVQQKEVPQTIGRGRGLNWMIFIAGILLVAGIVAGVTVLVSSFTDSSDDTSQEVAEPETPGVIHKKQSQETKPEALQDGSEIAKPDSLTPQSDRPENDADHETLGSAEPGAGGNATATGSTNAASSEDEYIVEILADESCWFEMEADGEDMKDYYLRSGERAVLRFSETLSLVLGNGGGVKIRYNREAYPFEAESGEVKRLTFPPKDQ